MADNPQRTDPAAPDRAAADPVLDPWTLLDNLPVPAAVHELSGEGKVRFANAAFRDTFGYTLEDIPTPEDWAARAYPDPLLRRQVMDQWWAQIDTRQRTGRIAPPEEYRLLDKAGRPRDVLIGFTLHGDLAIVTLQDVTAIRATESALDAERRKNEITAYALTENMPAGAYTMVLAPGAQMADFAFLSKRFLDMLDLTHEEAAGDPSTGFSRVHPDDRPGWVAENARAFAERRAFSGETRVVVHGETRWVRAESVPRPLDDGSIVWEGVLVDVTRLKQTEEQLKVVLSAAQAYTWRRDMRASRSEFDANWAALAGHPENERAISCDSWLRTVHPEDVAQVRSAVEALEAGRVERDILTYRRRIRDGEWIWLQVHAGISERDAEGRPTALSGVSFDITEEQARRRREQERQAALREELQRAQQRATVAQLAGGVAHDLNNLIGLVQWTVE